MRFLRHLPIVFFLAFGSNWARAEEDLLARYRFLLGEWVGENKGSAQESGKFTFALDLQGKILTRRNTAELPAAQGRPALKHEDILILYPGAGKGDRAIYFDNEGHVIQYKVSFADEEKTLVFVSDPSPSAPRFRLTYVREKDDVLGIKFEIASPGSPATFRTYLEGKARRVKPKSSKSGAER